MQIELYGVYDYGRLWVENTEYGDDDSGSEWESEVERTVHDV